MLLRKTPVALALAALVGPALAQAIPTPEGAASTPFSTAATAPAQSLSEITVSATRTARSVDSVPNTVTVINQDTLKKKNARDIKDLLDNEVDLSVRSQPIRYTSAASSSYGRSGDESLNVRGLEGNQVLLMMDGIRLPMTWSFGPFTSGRLDYVDVDSLATAEVLRGPASAQYGSDGLAGALSLRTLSPEDLLKDGKKTAGFVSTGYQGVDRSLKVTGGAAAEYGDWQGLVVVTRRQGHETQNMGDNDAKNTSRTAPNPEDYSANNLLAKVNYQLNAQHRLQATVDAHQLTRDVNVLSGRAASATSSSSVIDLYGTDKVQRTRLSLEDRYEDLNAPWLQSLRTTVYYQKGKTREYSYEDQYTGTDRTRDTYYQESIIGLSSQAQTQLTHQRVTYGLDVSRNQVEALRNGTPAGTDFPNKAFPDTNFLQTGAFVQDEIEWGEFSFIPGLRFEHYSLNPSADGYDGTVVKLSDHAFTPRLGIVWRALPTVQPYFQWAQGFRAPTPDEVNNSFSNLTYGYTSVGNPNLKAEHANSFELGLRGHLDETLKWQISAYNNRYRDFISQQVVSGSFTTADPAIYQYINLAKARIHGVEARAQWQPLKELGFTAAVAHAKGESSEDGVSTPLDTVLPTRINLGARYQNGPWDLQATVMHSGKKASKDISSSSYFAPPSYTVLNLGAAYQINKMLMVSGGVDNVTNKKYWRWSDVRGMSATSTVLDAYTAPGRTAHIALRADF